MIDVATITGLHRITVRRWHQQEIDNPYEGFWRLSAASTSRTSASGTKKTSPGAATSATGGSPRSRSGTSTEFNQRNDLIESVDDSVDRDLGRCGNPPRDNARQHGTPGSVIDRLSILSLRIYHMQEQLDREDAGRTTAGAGSGEAADLRAVPGPLPLP